MVLTVRIIDDIKEAQRAWEALSPKQTVFDDWNFRYPFFISSAKTPCFWAAYEQDTLVGLLPLQRTDSGAHEFFGGRFMYNNRVWTKSANKTACETLWREVTPPAMVWGLAEQVPAHTSETEYQYSMDLTDAHDFEDYLVKHLNSKYRSNLKRKIKLAQEYQVTVRASEPADLEALIKWNLKNFGEASTFHKPLRQQIFRNLLTARFTVRLLGFLVDGEPVGASLSIFYGNTYTYINSGSDRERFPHLSTLITHANVTDALAFGAKTFDAGLDDLGWKESWGMAKTPQYSFTKS